MADEIDETFDRSQFLLERDIELIRAKAAAMPKGAPGECDACGEPYDRIVDGLCCRCIDRYIAVYGPKFRNSR